MKEFLDTVSSWVHKIHKKFEKPRALKMTAEEEYIYEESWKDWKVRDHDHFTGEFREAAHNICNLRIQDRKFIPVIAHNLCPSTI